MKTALRIHVALNELVVGMICVTILVGAVAYFKVHQAPKPCPVAAASTEPTVEISQIIYYIPVPVKVNIHVDQPKPVPPVVNPEIGPESAPKEEEQPDPVFEHRTPVITSALRTPMSELDKK
jgi:hypothetical protein